MCFCRFFCRPRNTSHKVISIGSVKINSVQIGSVSLMQRRENIKRGFAAPSDNGLQWSAAEQGSETGLTAPHHGSLTSAGCIRVFPKRTENCINGQGVFSLLSIFSVFSLFSLFLLFVSFCQSVPPEFLRSFFLAILILMVK